MFVINKLSEGIYFDNLTYYYTGKSTPKYFILFKGPLIIYNDIKNDHRNKKKIKKNFDKSQMKY